MSSCFGDLAWKWLLGLPRVDLDCGAEIALGERYECIYRTILWTHLTEAVTPAALQNHGFCGLEIETASEQMDGHKGNALVPTSLQRYDTNAFTKCGQPSDVSTLRKVDGLYSDYVGLCPFYRRYTLE